MTLIYKGKMHPLSRGDTIALIAPSRAPTSDILAVCQKRIEEWGYRALVSDHLVSSGAYFAASEKERADELMRAWEDPSVAMIWPICGGYGASRLLPHLDWNKLAHLPAKPFVGMSDITALLVAFQKRGIPVFHGPTARQAALSPSDFSAKALFSLLSGEPTHSFAFESAEVIREGRAQGPLIGGNLTRLADHIGTPYQIETNGAILLLEDVNEMAYRLDGHLNQMEQAGLLAGLSGVICASFEGSDPKDGALNISLNEVIERYFSHAHYPVIHGFLSGHIEDQYTLPFGSHYEFDTAKRTLTLLETPFTQRLYVCTQSTLS